MDPAFVWQEQSAPPPPPHWITLDVAAEVTGLSAKRIRNWARKQKIRSKLVGDDRVVLRSEVVERARSRAAAEKKQPAKKDTKKPKPASPPKPPQAARDDKPVAATQSPDPPVPEGSMLVPIDEWRRILGQLGNLHEAGQQLAEARERAAKAETEAQFLRERVRDLRAKVEAAEKPPEQQQPQPATELPPSAEQADPGPFWLYLVRRWGTRSK